MFKEKNGFLVQMKRCVTLKYTFVKAHGCNIAIPIFIYLVKLCIAGSSCLLRIAGSLCLLRDCRFSNISDSHYRNILSFS